MGVGISQKKLAEKLGLSRATVSYVLNGKAEENRVPPETAERVREAGRRYGYIPNRLAQSLKQKHTGVIGISIMDFRMDWTHRLSMGVNEALQASETVPLFAVRGVDPIREREELQWMLERRADGIIVTNPMQANADFYRDLARRNVRLLFLSEVPQGMHAEIGYVLWDSPRALAAVVERVILSGRRRLAWIGSAYRETVSVARYAAFDTVAQQHGLSIPDRHRVIFPLDRAGFDHDLGDWIAREITHASAPLEAIICLNDETAAAVIPQLKAAGLAVPQDVLVTGVGNLPIPGSPFDALVTVHEPMRELGLLATRAMLQLIESPDMPPTREVIDLVQIHDHPGALGLAATTAESLDHLPTLRTALGIAPQEVALR